MGYATDLSNRRAWSLAFVVIAAISAIPIRAAIEYLSDLSAESAFVLSMIFGPGVVYGALRWLFDRFGWYKSVLGIRLTDIPDLRGSWEGFVSISPTESTRTEEILELTGDRLPCFVVIDQTWTHISLRFETGFTSSLLTMATLNSINSPGAPGFRYEYLVTPKVDSQLADGGIQQHTGTAHLLWDADDPVYRQLRGMYYNAPAHIRYGEYELTRSQRTSAEWRAGHKAPGVEPDPADSLKVVHSTEADPTKRIGG